MFLSSCRFFKKRGTKTIGRSRGLIVFGVEKVLRGTNIQIHIDHFGHFPARYTEAATHLCQPVRRGVEV